MTRQASTLEEEVGATLGDLQVMMAQIAEPILTGNTFGVDKSNDFFAGATPAVSMIWKADCSAVVESACSDGRQYDHGDMTVKVSLRDDQPPDVIRPEQPVEMLCHFLKAIHSRSPP